MIVMKTIRITLMLAILTILAGNQSALAAFYPDGDETAQPDTIEYDVYTGTVVDADNNDELPFATVEAVGTNVATVTNIDGEFILKIVKGENVEKVKVSYVGYQNNTLPLYELRQEEVTIELQPSSVSLQQVTIRPEDANALVDQILTSVEDNYGDEDYMMKGFYRETIKKGWRYVGISEAVVDIYKSPYPSDFRYDHVKLIQGRKSADVEKMDTVLFKLQGGPVTSLLLDVIKNPTLLFTNDHNKIYNFWVSDVLSINDRLHYVISFDQKEYVSLPFYEGKLYVDMDRMALTEAQFSLNIDNEEEAARMFIRRKPIGMSVIPQEATYRVKYTIQDDQWYFNYARAEARFKVDWDRKLFNTRYTTMSEIAITDRSRVDVERIPLRERFKRSDVLEDLVYVFFDQDFWGSYNLIEPDQSIESAISKLNRKFEQNQEEETNP